MNEQKTYRQRMEAELHDWETELDRWNREDEHANGAPVLRQEQQQMLEDLHGMRLRARGYLDELNRGADFEQLKPKMERLWAQIRAMITKVKTRA